MRHDKLERELYLIELLTENRNYNVERLCQKVGISRRNLYYYLEFFRDCGFKLYKHGKYYCIDSKSSFFNHIIDRITFTEQEAVLLRRLLDKISSENVLASHLKDKLDRFYDLDILTEDISQEQVAQNLGVLYEAIKFKRQILVRNYVSLHSDTVKDRLLEPFMLMDNNNEVRCFEPSSKLNKTFKISRMRGVEMLDTDWCYESSHKDMYTDVFMFSGSKRMPIKLLLGNLSYNILKDEYPRAMKYIEESDNKKYLLDMDVCSYVGIGRFVLGLYDDIEVLGDKGFKSYLNKKINKMNKV